jgi:predicted Zn-dependent peptidase
VLSVLATALGGGMSSRLFQNIREKHGMAYAIYSFADMLSDTGVLGVYLATDTSRVDKAIELVHKELLDLRKVPLLPEDLKGVKTQLKGNIMLGLEQVSSRMNRVAKMEIYLGKPIGLPEISRRIDAVTERQVKDLADELFNEEKLITIILEPENSINSN